MICSAYNAEARYSKKRRTEWAATTLISPRPAMMRSRIRITDVQTTPAPGSDFDMLPTIQAALVKRKVLPAERVVDAGYVTADQLVVRNASGLVGRKATGSNTPIAFCSASELQHIEVCLTGEFASGILTMGYTSKCAMSGNLPVTEDRKRMRQY
jgi:hypothetical protein